MITYKGLFPILYRMPESGVVAFRNDRLKTVYVVQSKNLKNLISKSVVEFKTGIHKHKELCGQLDTELVLLGGSKDTETRKLHVLYWIDHYENEGYTVLKDKRPLVYTVRTRISGHYNEVYVELLNRRREVKLVGAFKTMYEAEEFINEYYGDGNRYSLPVYANNIMTRELLKEEEQVDIRL